MTIVMPKSKTPTLTPKKQRLLNPPDYSKAIYVNVQKYWRRLSPIFRSQRAACIWMPCMLEYWMTRADEYKYEFKPPWNEPYFPAIFDSCDWRFERRGRHPAYWDFVVHGACHWIVDLDLFVAINAYPEIPWQILSSQRHSTVWNGDLREPLLFDVNYLALDVPPAEALQTAWPGRLLEPSRYLKEYLHPLVGYGPRGDANRSLRLRTSEGGPRTKGAVCSNNETLPSGPQAL